MTDVRTKRTFNRITVSDNQGKRRDRRLKDNPQDYKAVKPAMAVCMTVMCMLLMM